MKTAREMIDEMKDPVLRVIEQLDEDLSVMADKVANLEERIDLLVEKIVQLNDERGKSLELQGELLLKLNGKVSELEQWSNVHTHAQSEELKITKPSGSKAKRLAALRKIGDARGKFCLHCHKRLNEKARNQRIFCSPMHASAWYKAHPGEDAYPLTKLQAGGFETKVTAGEAVESEAYAART